MKAEIDKIKTALADPKAPWYGSDLVEWVADLLAELEAEPSEFTEKCRKSFGEHTNWPDWAIHTELMKACDHIDRQVAENAKLNIILYHRENGLSHPDLQAEIDKSKLIEIEAENKRLKEERTRYRGCLEFLRVTHANSTVKDRAIEQALKGKLI